MAEGPTLRVYGLPPIWGAPSPSPFAIKLMTWLRMAGIEYEAPVMKGPPRSRTKKIPYVKLPSGEHLHDSGLIIERLSRDFGVDLDADLDPRARGVGLAVTRMLDEHLYFAGLWERWSSDPGYAATASDYFKHMPAPVRLVLPWMLRRKMRAYAHGQGMGRHDTATIAALAKSDLDALAGIVGEREFILGPPSNVDASALGMLWAMQSNPYESFIADALAAHPNLVAYADRMRARYWADFNVSRTDSSSRGLASPPA